MRHDRTQEGDSSMQERENTISLKKGKRNPKYQQHFLIVLLLCVELYEIQGEGAGAHAHTVYYLIVCCVAKVFPAPTYTILEKTSNVRSCRSLKAGLRSSSSRFHCQRGLEFFWSSCAFLRAEAALKKYLQPEPKGHHLLFSYGLEYTLSSFCATAAFPNLLLRLGSVFGEGKERKRTPETFSPSNSNAECGGGTVLNFFGCLFCHFLEMSVKCEGFSQMSSK